MFIDRHTMIDTEYTVINNKGKVSLPSQGLRIKDDDRDMSAAGTQELSWGVRAGVCFKQVN